MKIFSLLLATFTTLLAISLSNGNESSKTQVKQLSAGESLIKVINSPELSDIVLKWTEDYSLVNKDVKFDISSSENNNLISQGNIYFVAGENYPDIRNESIWKMKIGSDAVVPIMNKSNPLFLELSKKGITAEKLKQLLTESENQNWQSLIAESKKSPIHFLIIENENVISRINSFIKVDLLPIQAKYIRNAEELISEIQKDKNAVGFCRLSDIIDVNNNVFITDIGLVPIDKNKNSRIDNFENIYSSPSSFIHGVWLRKYPLELSNSIYAVSVCKPTDIYSTAFLTWITSEGQKSLTKNGFCNLSTREKETNLAMLNIPKVYDIQDNKPTNYAKLITVLIVIFMVAVMVLLVYYRKRVKFDLNESEINIVPALNENSINAPAGLFFDKTHTWVFMEKDGVVKVGIDDFLQHVTGKITRVTMKNAGEKIRKGESIVTLIRDGKHLNIYSPVTGTIKQQNNRLSNDSSLLNSSPFNTGWIYEIVPKNWLREIQFMFMGEKYKEWIADEFVRLKDFFALSVKSNQMLYNQVVLQDGGELSDNMLADFGPEVWDDFQTHFIDSSK